MIAVVPGCGVFAKKQECKLLVDDVTRTTNAIKTLEKSEDPRKVANMARTAGATATQLSSDLSGRSFSVSEVKQFAGDYSGFAREVGVKMNDLAKVMDQFADLKDQVDEQKPASVTKKFTAATQKFGDACKRPMNGCLGVARVLQRLPKKTDDMDAYARGMATAAADMKKVPQDAALKPTVDELVRQTEALGAVFQGIGDGTRKLKTTQAELDAIVAREPPMLASINAFCVPPAKK